MPGFITHYICGRAVLNALPPDVGQIIQEHASVYNMGTQGPDIFFYYLPGLLKKNVRDIGSQMHKCRVGLFVKSMLDALPNGAPANELQKETSHILFAYISGYLTHYALDAGAHPYVYYKTGMRKKGDKARAIKYSVDHRKFETAIDVLMLKLMSSQKPADYKLWQLIKTDSGRRHVVAEAVSASIETAYGRHVTPRDVYNAMTYMIQLTRILQSKKGRRKRLMELIENLTIGEHLFSSIIHMQEVKDGVDYMNMGKIPWRLPGYEEKTDSFVEMYHMAVLSAAEMIDLLYKYMQGQVSREQVLQTIGSRSLATGTDC